jgi:predicted lipoprotein with Yx(FWY)xxD motif
MLNNRSNTERAAASHPWVVSTAAAVATFTALAFLIMLSAAPGDAAGEQGPVVSTASSKLGRILVNSRGHTLYLFAKDRNGKSACSRKCAAFWPPLIASGKPRATAGAKASLLGTVRRADGRMQVTYKRHPLYTFAKDTRKGQTNGEELYVFGAEWYAVSPAGNKIEKGGGGGY